MRDEDVIPEKDMLVFLGAEGCSECEEAGVNWLGEPTEEQVHSTRRELGEKFKGLQMDSEGRPYRLVVVRSHAPESIRKQAYYKLRTLRFHE